MIVTMLYLFVVLAVFVLLWRAVNFKTAIVGLSFVVGAFLMWRIGDFLLFFWGFSWLGEYMSESLGINPRAAMLLSVPFVFFLVVTGKMSFSLQPHRRTLGFYLFFSGVFFYYVMAYALTSQYNFDPRTGKALVRVAPDNSGGLKKTFGKMVDPITGQPTQPITPESFREIERDEKDPTFQKVPLSADLEFFDRGGNGKYWYGENINGDVELFNKNGHHPQTNAPLQPLTPDVVKRLLVPSEQGAEEVEGKTGFALEEGLPIPSETGEGSGLGQGLGSVESSVIESEPLEEDIQVDLTTDPGHYKMGDNLKVLASELKAVQPQ